MDATPKCHCATIASEIAIKKIDAFDFSYLEYYKSSQILLDNSALEHFTRILIKQILKTFLHIKI